MPDSLPPAPDIDETLALTFEQSLKSRAFLIQRLSDIVCWPETRIPAFERQLAADVLVGLLRTANVELRARCATRLALLVDAPKMLLRYLARDEIVVARHLIENSPALDEADLVATIRSGVRAHWLAIANRRHVPPLVCEALVRTGDETAVEAILRNPGARFSHGAIDSAVLQSREAPGVAPLVARRAETSPAQALTMFWWADHETRVHILRRFAVDRAILCAELGDIFRMAATENWADPETRKAIALLERRQRSRGAADRSPYGSLENAIAAGAQGIDRELIEEISHLSGIRPQTGMKIMTDRGGEGIAVLCKATGLKRDSLRGLWTGLRRSMADADNQTSAFDRVMYVYDLLANAKAQTVLRYWNWSLTSAVAPGDIEGLDPAAEEDEFSPARRSAALVFGRRG
jgi:uncharacterized protein (DUF2336 family)